MALVSATLQRQIVYLISIVVLLFITKPPIIFKPNGKPRLYGFGYDDEGYKKTLYTFQFIIFIIALLVSVYL
jgi:hypothetical protein